MHKGGWDEILMYPPLNLSQEKRGMVWVRIKVLWESMMNSTNCRQEFEWAPAWGKKDGIHHYSYRKVTSDQHRLSSNIPNMDNQVEESKSMWWW